jgi:hypothetical protein
MPSSHRRIVAVACVLVCGTAAIGSWSLRTGYVRTQDRNHDGRVDVWRFYDARGELTRASTDTNFDGQSDQEEYYDGGHLVRRISDRNFDDRADVVEEFDARSDEPVREVVDVDFDGRADLLVLFQGGQPVFSKWAPPSGAPGGGSEITARLAFDTQDSTAALAPFVDPFRGDAACRSTVRPQMASAALLTAADRAVDPVRAGPPDGMAVVRAPSIARVAPTAQSAHLTRGPPFAPLV